MRPDEAVFLAADFDERDPALSSAGRALAICSAMGPTGRYAETIRSTPSARHFCARRSPVRRSTLSPSTPKWAEARVRPSANAPSAKRKACSDTSKSERSRVAWLPRMPRISARASGSFSGAGLPRSAAEGRRPPALHQCGARGRAGAGRGSSSAMASRARPFGLKRPPVCSAMLSGRAR